MIWKPETQSLISVRIPDESEARIWYSYTYQTKCFWFPYHGRMWFCIYHILAFLKNNFKIFIALYFSKEKLENGSDFKKANA